METNNDTYAAQTQGQQPIMISEKYKREQYNGEMGNGNGGVPGEVTNSGAPNGYMASTPENKGNYNNDEGTRNYQPNHSVQRVIKEPALLKDTSVSVAFNAPADAEAPAGAIKQRADNIARMVGAAAGITDVQNKVFVNAMPFNTDAADKEAEAAAAAARNAMLAKWGTVGASILLALLAFGLLIMSFRRKRAEDEMNAIDEALPRLPSEDLGITLIDDESELLGVDRIQDLPPATPDEQRLLDIQKELAAFIKSQPKDAVKLVRAWMTEDD
jgi:flagellar biosynthesis/type III secretory pathway M-ring protein FliF/YscJ